MGQALTGPNRVAIVCVRAVRRFAVVAWVVAVLLGSANLATGAVAGLTTAVTVSIAGTTGWWASAEPSAALPGGTAAPDPASASPAPSVDQSIVPTPAPTQTIPPTATSAPSVGEPSIVDKSQPATGS